MAENRLLGASPESMLAAMEAAGQPAEQAREALLKLELDPVFVGAQRVQRLQHKLESVLSCLQQVRALHPDADRIARLPRLSRDTWLRDFVAPCRPVVLTEVCQDWPALHGWAPEALRQQYGHVVVEVQSGRAADPDYERNKLRLRREMPLADLIDRALAGGPSNDLYLTANNLALRRPALTPLLADVGTLPAGTDRSQLPGAALFWFGPAGTVTPLHHDTLMLFHTQVVGRKRWRFVSPLDTHRLSNLDNVFSPIDLDRPDLARFPSFAGVQVLETVVGPGETLFLPIGWWHQVTALDLSVSLSYTNLDVPNSFEFRNPAIGGW
jgi:hypothetical protein